MTLITLLAILRQLFYRNNVALTAGFTGASAFNILGETLHHLTGQGISGDYKPCSLSASKKQRLAEKFQHLLCLIIDERSLLSSKLLGTTAQIIKETIFSGCNSNEMLGGLPVLILAGDDYQLPGIAEGAFNVLKKVGGPSKMTNKGREVFKECAKNVFELKTIRRVQDKKSADKELINRVRLGTDVTDDDVKKLQSLHLENIRKEHGDEVVKEIEDQAIYLFWTNAKRIRHNLEKLVQMNSDDNPTAVIKPIGKGIKYSKSIRSHFTSDIPTASLLCVKAKVCIKGCNFSPMLGLHNGACGTVREIVFGKGKNPNNGDHPLYVVVHFPQYKGPVWDIDHPKVTRSFFFAFTFKQISPLIPGYPDPNYPCPMCLSLLSAKLPAIGASLCKDSTHFPGFKCWTRR